MELLRPAPMLVLLIAGVLITDHMPACTSALLQEDYYQHSSAGMADILSLAGRVISTVEKTQKSGPYVDWHLALASTKVVVDLINTAFKHEDGSSWKLSQEIQDAYYDANVACKRMVRKVYAAAVAAETEVGMLRAVQESLKRKPDHAPSLRQLQIMISGTGISMPESLEGDLEDVLSSYMRVIKLCQSDAIAKERKQVFSKMSGALAVGMVSGAAGLHYALFEQVYSVTLGAAMVSMASFSKVRELQRNFAILEDRMEFLKEAKDEACRRYSSVSDIQTLVRTLQSRILQGVTKVAPSDLRLQDGMRMFVSPDMTHRLDMHSQDLLKLQDECFQLSYILN